MSGESWNKYVFRDGRFIGQFEEMYQANRDPWYQKDAAVHQRTRLLMSDVIRRSYSGKRVVELGCGEGHLAATFLGSTKAYLGVDVSETAIERAHSYYPEGEFQVGHFRNYATILPGADFVLLSDVIWYVLDHLNSFVSWLRAGNCTADIGAILTFYPEGEQRYGREYFTNPQQFRDYMQLDYMEFGDIYQEGHGFSSYFVGRAPTPADKRV